MNRSEFLNKLRETLENDLSAQVVQENIEYYDSYIRSEVQNGRTEQEVLEMLGDPWVIARTIINSAENERDYYGGPSSSYGSGQSTYTEEEEKEIRHPILHLMGIDTWWKRLLFFAGVIIVLMIVVSVVTGLIAAVLPFALPLLILILVLRIMGGR